MPRRLVLEDSPLMPMAAHLGQGFLHPERLGTIEKVECYLVNGSVSEDHREDTYG